MQIFQISRHADLNQVFKTRFEAWGDQLSFEAFLERELLFRSSSWYKAGLKTWALKSNNTILASCETLPIKMKCATKDFSGLAIASVLVETQMRKNGYATHLLKNVVDIQKKDYDFLCLFSEVGPNIYARCGFKTHPVSRLTIETNLKHSSFASHNKDIQLLNESDALSLWEKSINSSRSLLKPLKEQVQWNWMRSRFYAKKLRGHDIRHFGITLSNSLIIFSFDIKYKALKVLHCSKSPTISDENWFALWEKLIELSNSHDLAEIQAWATPDLAEDFERLKNFYSGTLEDEKDDIPMVQFTSTANPEILNLDIEMQCWV